MDKIYSMHNNSGIAGLFHIPQASQSLYYCLHGIQHRGSDGAGMAVSNGQSIQTHKGLGMLSEVFKPSVLEEMEGYMAIGQVRMACLDDIGRNNLQPVMVRAHQGTFALVFSGMLTNAPRLRRQMEEEGLVFAGTSDCEIIAHLIQVSQGTLFEKIKKATQLVQGAYTLLLMTKNTMYAFASGDGVHPLFMAKVHDGYAFGSETSAFGMLHADKIRQLQPGEMVVLGKNGYESHQIQISRSHGCAMEYVYYSRPDSSLHNCSIYASRQKAGKLLAQKEKVDADIVIGVPDTANVAAAAFARQLGKPYEIGLIKNRYIGSTFIRPTQMQREQGMRVRLNAISSIVRGRRIYVVDDSMQRGITARRICQLLKEAGASEIHVRIACAPIAHSCFYGTEYFDVSNLASASYTTRELEALFHADSIVFLDEEEMKQIVPAASCMACMNGDYPVALDDYEKFTCKKGIENGGSV